MVLMKTIFLPASCPCRFLVLLGLILCTPLMSCFSRTADNNSKELLHYYLKSANNSDLHFLHHKGNHEVREKPLVALTFDDGPNPGTTPSILKELKKHKVKATFFLVGERVKRYPELARQIVAGGHDVGNHGYRHANLSKLNNKEINREIQLTQKIIQETAGKTPFLFRPPHGTINETVIRIAEKNKLKIILWSVDPREYNPGLTTGQVMDIIKASVKPNSIILSHDTKLKIVEMLPDLLDFLEKNNFRIVPVSAMS